MDKKRPRGDPERDPRKCRARWFRIAYDFKRWKFQRFFILPVSDILKTIKQG